MTDLRLPTLEELDAALSTERRRRFVVEYCKDSNGTQAAIRSGYSAATAGQISSHLLKDIHIKAAIKARRDQLFDEIQVDAAWITRQLKEIAAAKITDVVSFGPDHVKSEADEETGIVTVSPGVTLNNSEDLPEHVKGAIAEVSTTKDGIKFKMHDRRAAINDLAKLGGYVVDKVEHSGAVGVTVDLASLTDEELAAYALLAEAAERRTNGKAGNDTGPSEAT